MTRRRYLLAVAMCLLLAGCGGVIGDDPRETPSASDDYRTALAVDAPTISPGETGTLTIEMRNTTGLHVDRVQSENVSIDYGGVAHSRPPSVTWTSLPPSWGWESTNVTTTLPVVATENATRGRYEVTIIATVDGERRNRTAVVTVE
ncbi:hypothetical protein ACOZ4N_12460 [Halorientalis pallida]|uniref:hypothetical protein n=1 Tax=Halorientalis pallida TaxID=2479928 RepID=UPI003C6FAD39